MKIYLDDERPTPEGWIGCRWPEEVIELLKTGEVTAISLDHDLGEWNCVNPRTGKQVLDWLEEQVFEHNFDPPLWIYVHSMNPTVGQQMRIIAARIRRHVLNKEGGRVNEKHNG